MFCGHPFSFSFFTAVLKVKVTVRVEIFMEYFPNQSQSHNGGEGGGGILSHQATNLVNYVHFSSDEKVGVVFSGGRGSE